MEKKVAWKTCSRGHKYKGSGPCSVCWPGRLKRQHIVYHKDGSIWAKGKMLARRSLGAGGVNGKCEGYWEWFRKPVRRGGGDGTKMRSGYFKSNKQTGEWITYDRKGRVYKVTNIKK